MDPRDHYRCARFFSADQHEVLSQLRDTWHTLWQGMPRSQPCLNCMRFLFFTIRDLQPSGSLKVVTSVTGGLHPCHFRFRCDEALSGHANCVKQPRHWALCPVRRDSFIGVSSTGPCSAFGRKHVGRSFNYQQDTDGDHALFARFQRQDSGRHGVEAGRQE